MNTFRVPWLQGQCFRLEGNLTDSLWFCDSDRTLGKVEAIGRRSGAAEIGTEILMGFDRMGVLFTVLRVYRGITKPGVGTGVSQIISDKVRHFENTVEISHQCQCSVWRAVFFPSERKPCTALLTVGPVLASRVALARRCTQPPVLADRMKPRLQISWGHIV